MSEQHNPLNIPTKRNYKDVTEYIEHIARKLPHTSHTYSTQTWDQIAQNFNGKNCKFEEDSSSPQRYTVTGQIGQISAENGQVFIKLTSGTIFVASLNEHNNYWHEYPEKTRIGTITMTK